MANFLSGEWTVYRLFTEEGVRYHTVRKILNGVLLSEE